MSEGEGMGSCSALSVEYVAECGAEIEVERGEEGCTIIPVDDVSLPLL